MCTKYYSDSDGVVKRSDSSSLMMAHDLIMTCRLCKDLSTIWLDSCECLGVWFIVIVSSIATIDGFGKQMVGLSCEFRFINYSLYLVDGEFRRMCMMGTCTKAKSNSICVLTGSFIDRRI